MRTTLILSFITCCFFCINRLTAQESFISQYKVAIHKGFEESIVPKHTHDENLDFMNYVYRFPLLLEDSYTALSTHLWFRNRMEVNFQALMLYNVNLKNVNFALSYFPKENLGYNVGILRYEQIFTGFYDFPFIENDGSFVDFADRRTKLRVFDRAIYSGLIVRKTINKFQIEGKFNGGAGSFTPFSISLLLKKKDSNLKRKIEYKTFETWYGFIFPEMQVSYIFFKNGRINYGIELQANSLIWNRAVNYAKTTYNWTDQDYSSEMVKRPGHFYFRYEWDLGIYIKW